MNGVVTSRLPCYDSGLGDLEWSFRAVEFQVYPGVLPQSVLTLQAWIVSVLFQRISHLFSLRFDACDREVLVCVNSIPFAQNVYPRNVPTAF